MKKESAQEYRHQYGERMGGSLDFLAAHGLVGLFLAPKRDETEFFKRLLAAHLRRITDRNLETTEKYAELKKLNDPMEGPEEENLKDFRCANSAR
jgi:hypothetical protein